MRKINFFKMQALGNDFVLIDNTLQNISFTAKLAAYLADRKYGIGCDQVLIINKLLNNTADYSYRIFNADGSEVSQCGNGASCIGLYLQQNNLINKNNVKLLTNSGIVHIKYDNNLIAVNMGIPSFAPLVVYDFNNSIPRLKLFVVSIGNPHVILNQDELSLEYLEQIGNALNYNNQLFPEGVNVSIAKIVDSHTLSLKTYERGVGLTLSCGSAASAAALYAIRDNLLPAIPEKITVNFNSGSVYVSAKNFNSEGVYLFSSPTCVFTGNINI